MEANTVQTKFWVERLADEVIKKFPNISVYHTENGIGASGFPHIGSLSDAVRSYGVKLALEDRKLRAEHIAYSDDKDGLRKVPRGLPGDLERYIGVPVTSIPDPFKCHGSYGEHMGSLLLDGLDKLGIKYRFYSGAQVYKQGLLNRQIDQILKNWEKVGKIIFETTGQEKYTKMLPYLPVCRNCGRIYTTEANLYDASTGSVSYTCTGGDIAGKFYRGCGFEGESKLTDGEGKLAWKAEFAARWAALDVSFEAYGKELTDSIASNDRICREVLNHEPPVHTRYEIFLNKEGKKMSKSSGELITHDEWLRYGSPASLRLLMFKRFEGAREVGLEDIPVYMEELRTLEEVYFGQKIVSDKAELQDKISLYRYTCLLDVPSKPSIHPPYNLLVYLCRLAPEQSSVDFVLEKLRDYGYAPKDEDERVRLLEEIHYAYNWAKDHKIIAGSVQFNDEEKGVLLKILEILETKYDEQGYQSTVYEAAKSLKMDPKRVFQTFYKALIGKDSGPRIGPYIKAMGRDSVIDRLRQIVGDSGRPKN
jgi:lysyl-tRNA synthetase class 1